MLKSSLLERGLPWLWAARTLSSFGTTLTVMTIIYWATTHLHLSGTEIAFVELGPLVVVVFSALFVGVVVDSVDRRVLISVVQVGSAAVLLVGMVLAWTDSLGLWALVAINALLAVFSSFERPAKFACFYDMVGDELIDRANGVMQTINTTTDALGGVIAGVIIKVLGAPVLLLVDALSFLLEAVAPWTVRWAHPEAIKPTPREDQESYWHRALGGFSLIKKDPLIRVLVLMSTAANGVIAFASVPLMIMLLRQAGFSYLMYTIILSFGSVGSILGGILAPRIGRRLTGPRSQWLAVLAFAFFMAGYTLLQGHSLPWLVLALAVDFGYGVAVSVYIVNNATSQHRAIDSKVRGRVGAARSFLGAVVTALTTALGGFLVDRAGPVPLLLAAAVALLLVALSGAVSLSKRSGADAPA